MILDVINYVGDHTPYDNFGGGSATVAHFTCIVSKISKKITHETKNLYAMKWTIGGGCYKSKG